jgi:hypothetical protein
VKLYTLCFILFVAFIAGPAWIPYKLYDPATAAAHGLSDSLDYLALADNQFVANPVHRYRVVEPLIVRVFARTHPRQGFFVLNLALTAAAATCLLAMLLESVPLTVALLSSLVFLGSRDVIEATGTPMIDPSLYLLIAGCFLALKKQSRWALALTLLLAPTIKENGLFLFPLIFLFGSLSTGNAPATVPSAFWSHWQCARPSICILAARCPRTSPHLFSTSAMYQAR